MFNCSTMPISVAMKSPVPSTRQPEHEYGRFIGDVLARVAATLNPQRRIVRAGDLICQAGEAFEHLYVINSGIFKMLSRSADGREQLTGLKFRGDWLGFSAISRRKFMFDAVAMDTGEVWAVRYDAVQKKCAEHPDLMAVVHEAMSEEIMRDRDSLMSVCTLPANARVAEFLLQWVNSLASRGQRADQFTLHLSRAEVGNHLGMTLESVSRALSRLARDKLINFTEKSRRDIAIPDTYALEDFIQQCILPARVQ